MPDPWVLAESMPHWTDEQMASSLAHGLRGWNGACDLWIFAYGSLLWKPELDVAEARPAKIYGHHRSLCLWSTVNRGTPECPGLVLALDLGGSCQGLAYRIDGARVREQFLQLWKREMVRGSYRPTWIRAHTPAGSIHALTFVMNRNLPTYAGRLSDAQVLDVLGRACGRCGTSAEYVCATIAALESHGFTDPRLARYRDLIRSLP